MQRAQEQLTAEPGDEILIVGGPRFPPQTGPVSRQVHFTKRHRPQQDSQPCCAPPSISVRQQLWDQV